MKIETDAGMQTRLLRFDAPATTSEAPSLQGYSVANWERPVAGRPTGFALPIFSGNIGRAGRSLEVATTHLLPGYTRGVLVAHVQGNGRITPYAWWASRIGLWPLWTLVIVILALATVAPLLHRACRTSGPEAG